MTNPSRLGTRLKLARQTRGLTLKALSEAANCSESLLSKIENGKASPSLPMLHRLVQVLETNIGWMFEESDGEEGIVFRAGARPLIALDPLRRGEGISLERIIPYSQGHLLQCNIHHIEKDGASAGPIQHAGEEVGYVLAGEIELIVGERQFQLTAGDSFVFNSDLPHPLPQHGHRTCKHFLGQHATDVLSVGPGSFWSFDLSTFFDH